MPTGSNVNNRIALCGLLFIGVLCVVGMVWLFKENQPGSASALLTIVSMIVGGLLGLINPAKEPPATGETTPVQVTNTPSDPVNVTSEGS